jgi:hypothetical protein
MTENFTLEDLFIKIIPGGVLIGILYFIYGDALGVNLVKGLDFFYTFLFFTFSFLMGEVLQTIAHEFEWMIFSFFKFYKPSEIFLYKDNPVLKNEHIRQRIIDYLTLSDDEQNSFNKEYKELPLFWWKREKQNKAQSYFWKLYTKVSAENEMRKFNRGYLLTRAINIVLIISSVIFYIESNKLLMFSAILLFILFLWRARGMARTLVFKTIMLNLKEQN